MPEEMEVDQPVATEESDDVVADAGVEEPIVEIVLSVDILPLIKESQQHHGLRHGDYQRYRQYCTRRLERIRKSLNFKLGNRHGFKKKPIDDAMVTDSRYLQIVLMNAERAWSYAMELKLFANTEPRKKFHMVRKLQKASAYATQLNSLTQNSEKVDARTKLEAQAYSYWMTANLKFELQDWQTAVDLYTKARTIYEKLSTAFVDESTKILYLQKVDEISPNIRYCGYNLGQGGVDINELMKMRSSAAGQDLLQAKIDAAIAETREKLASSFGEVNWRGRTVPIRTEKARICILRVQEKESELNRQYEFDGKMEVFDNLLMECKDVLAILKDEIAAETVSKKKSETALENLNFVRTYVGYLRQNLLIERNLVMAENLQKKLPSLIGEDKQQGKGKISKPEDLVRLFDSIIQCLSETSQLSGISSDEKMMADIEAQTTAYKGFRVFYIAQSYQQQKKWIEAVALYDRTISYTQLALGNLQKCENVLFNTLIENTNDLAHQAKGHKFAAHAASILESPGVEDEMNKLSLNDKQVLVDQLEVYTEYKTLPKKLNLVHFPPEIQPLPLKPLFFDLALNHVELPDISARVEKKKESSTLGMVKGWLWGGK